MVASPVVVRCYVALFSAMLFQARASTWCNDEEHKHRTPKRLRWDEGERAHDSWTPLSRFDIQGSKLPLDQCR